MFIMCKTRKNCVCTYINNKYNEISKTISPDTI